MPFSMRYVDSPSASRVFQPPSPWPHIRSQPTMKQRPVLRSFADGLPAGLKSSDLSVQRKAWPDWVAAHDREIRGRLLQGDEDTVVNWLMFGTSFTKEPRALFEVPEKSSELPKVVSRRIADLMTALRSAHPDERSTFARQLLLNQGYRLDTARERTRLERHFHDEVDRVLAERQQYARREDCFVPATSSIR